jgi:outer membrane protein TolC
MERTYLEANQLNATLPSDAVTALKLQTPYSSQIGISASQTILSAAMFSGQHIAKVYTDLADKNIQQTEIELAYKITKAYYTVLLQQEQLKVANENLQSLETGLKAVQKMFENGTIEKIELRKMEVKLLNLQAEKEKVAAFHTLAIELLKFQIGLSQTDEITLSDNLNNWQIDDLKADNQLVSYEKRNDFNILQAQYQLQLQEQKNVKNLRYPTISLFAQAGANIGTLNFGSLFGFNDWYSLLSVGLRVQVPIFAGFKQSHIEQQQKLGVIKTENLLTETKRSIDFQQKQTTINYSNAKKQLEIQKRNWELAEEIAQITKVKYKEGLLTDLDVIQADAKIYEAKANYWVAKYELLLADLEKAKARGQ